MAPETVVSCVESDIRANLAAVVMHNVTMYVNFRHGREYYSNVRTEQSTKVGKLYRTGSRELQWKTPGSLTCPSL